MIVDKSVSVGTLLHSKSRSQLVAPVEHLLSYLINATVFVPPPKKKIKK